MIFLTVKNVGFEPQAIVSCGALLGGIKEHVCTLPCRSQDIGLAVPIDVSDEYLSSYARVIVDQMRNPLHRSAGLANELKPIQHGRRLSIGTAEVISMRPPSL